MSYAKIGGKMKRGKSYFSFLVKSSIYPLYLSKKKKKNFLNSSNFVIFKGKCSHFHVLFLFAKNRFSSLLCFSYPLSFHFPIPPSLRDTQWRSFVGMPVVPPCYHVPPSGAFFHLIPVIFSSFFWCCDVAFTAPPPLHFPASCPLRWWCVCLVLYYLTSPQHIAFGIYFA